MNKLNYLKDFNTFSSSLKLNESLGDAGQKAINRAFMNMADIPLTNGEFLRPKDVVKVVSEAIDWIGTEFRTYYSFARDCNIIYLVNCPDCNTMAVDAHMNMFMDALFVYRDLKMNPQLVATVIMHEIFHVVYNHIERGKNWLSANGRPMTDFRDTNLAADIEVNSTLINKGITDQATLVGEIHGLYLPKHNGEKTNIPMEMILENEKLMAKLREMVQGPKDTRPKQETSEDWDDGYKKGWDKVAELLDKYGAEETVKKLQDAGIIDENGQFLPDIDEETILGMNMLQVKSFSQFIFESVQKENQDLYQTYDDGFKTGVQKAIGMIWNALHPQEGGGGGGHGGNPGGEEKPIPQSNLKPDDLKKLNLPKSEKKDQQQSGQQFGDNLPTNTNDEQKGGGGGSSSQKPKTKDQQQVGDMQGSDDSSDGNGNGEGKDGKNSDGNGQEGEQSGSGSQDGQGDGQGKEGQEGQQGKEGSGSSDSEKGGDESNGSGSGGGSGQESGSGDVNKLADDLKNKNNNKGQKPIDSNVGYADKPQGKGEDKDGIGGTGSFIDDPDSSFAKKVLKESGYSDEDIKNIVNDTIEKNKRLNTPEGIKEKRKKLYSKLSPSDPVKKLLDDIEVSEAKFKNIWKKIMKQFLGQNCRHAGKDKRSKNFDWKNKRALSLGRLAPNFHKEEQEPQNINIYVDVSGSVNEELLTVIAKSLAIFCNTYEYTGINIIPWASSSNGVHEVESVKQSSPEKVAKEILGYISQGISECGGGTNLIEACLPEIVAISNNKARTKKDDKHIIITDGETFGQESEIEKDIAKECGAIVTKNCFWMIYDAPTSVRNSWEKSISKGTLLFLDSKIVIGNG